MKSTLLRGRAPVPGRYALLTALILAVRVPAVAVGAGEGRDMVAGKRNPRAGGEFTRETEIIADNATYGTRQSDKRTADAAHAFGVAANPANKNQVLVDQLDDPTVPTAFQLQVIC